LTASLHPGDPLDIFERVFREATAREPFEPHAMVLSTVKDGRPRSRVVLLKGVDARGFVFHTNYESDKGREIDAAPFVALNFHFPKGEQQVRIEGPIEKLSNEESDAYFATRPRLSRIGAWASDQSRPLESREAFDARVAEIERRFSGVEVPRPLHWGGYLVRPLRIEFWYGQQNRLHDRFAYERSAVDAPWSMTRLFP
jgi:pyridoxamine 5'-phosphate oxidase